MKKISLNKDIGFDLDKLIQSRAVILANSGGGKSYAIRKIAEGAVDKVQTIIIDPEGEFASLREKYDFILAGKGADVPVETRSAALLATKLLELGKSAVIDLYELHPSERQRFVKLFCESLINCPKELYHPVIIILDEAHEYVPEGKPSEATWAVEALASKGRKRGFCLIPASQRIAKLSKNVSAECNNKLIGRASQDIDMKRAGDELGFNKEKLVQLRQLKPGEFFAFGPAISDEVIQIKIGEVKTSHAKVSYKGATKVPPPSHVIKKVLGELIDLPAEAEKEAKTIADYKSEIKLLKTKIAQIPQKKVEIDPRIIQNAVSAAIKSRDEVWNKIIKDWEKYYYRTYDAIKKAWQDVDIKDKPANSPDNTINVYKNEYKQFIPFTVPKNAKVKIVVPLQYEAKNIKFNKDTISVDISPKGPEKRILNAIRWLMDLGVVEPEQTAVAFLAGYTVGRGGFNNPKGSLRTQGLVEYRPGNKIVLTEKGFENSEPSETPVDTQSLHSKVLSILPGPEKKLLEPLLACYPESITNEELAERSGYTNGSGGFNNPKGRLRTLGLVEYPQPGYVKAKSLLFLD